MKSKYTPMRIDRAIEDFNDSHPDSPMDRKKLGKIIFEDLVEIVQQRYVSQLCKGEKLCDLTLLVKIATVLETTPNKLINYKPLN